MRQKVKRYVSIDKTELKTEEYVIYHEFGNATDIEFPKDDSFVLLLFENGSGIHRIETKDYEIKPLQVQMVSVGQ